MFQVVDEGGHWLVELAAHGRKTCLNTAVMIPITKVDLYESHALFDHSPSQEAFAGKRWLFQVVLVNAVEVEDVLWFTRQIDKFRRTGLHAKCEFVGSYPGGNFRVPFEGEALSVELIDGVDDIAVFQAGDSPGGSKVENRRSAVT